MDMFQFGSFKKTGASEVIVVGCFVTCCSFLFYFTFQGNTNRFIYAELMNDMNEINITDQMNENKRND